MADFIPLKEARRTTGAALYSHSMKPVTRILTDIGAGNTDAAAELLPLVYDELRKLAAARLASEKPGQTLQPTALVHEAYLRLVDVAEVEDWKGRGHFFGAAAEAMRRILVENARRKSRQKRGGQLHREDLDANELVAPDSSDEVLKVNAALEGLAIRNPTAAQLVTLRYFAGFNNNEAAELLDISPRKASQLWTYARTWLLAEIEDQD